MLYLKNTIDQRLSTYYSCSIQQGFLLRIGIILVTTKNETVPAFRFPCLRRAWQADECQKQKHRQSTPDRSPKYGSRKEGHGVRKHSAENCGTKETAAVDQR